MKICVTAESDNLEAQVDSRFGRCQYFIIIDPESLEFEAIQNPNVEGMGGVGIQSAQLVSGKEVEVVLTGNVGPNAFQTLEAANIKVIVGLADKSVKEAIEGFKKGELKTVDGPSVGSKSGMGPKADNC